MKDSNMFMKYFFDHFAPLANDKVGNVRVTVAKTLRKVFKKESTPLINSMERFNTHRGYL